MKYTVHKNSDNRYRAYYEDNTMVSYPRILMEEFLNRKLNSDEVVHHIDGNPENNDISNLMVLTRSEHARLHQTKYFDEDAVCCVCGKTFTWTAKRQVWYYSDLNRGKPRIITCSKSCSSYYGREKQLNRL